MTPKEYNVFYKTQLPASEAWSAHTWDVFASAFNSSERVQLVFDRVSAKTKYWLIHSEYDYKDQELPEGLSFRLSADEAQSIKTFVQAVEHSVGRSIKLVSALI